MSNTMKRIVGTLAAVVLAAILAGCGTATHSAVSATPASTPVSTASTANVQVCQDYAKQRAWVKAHRALLTLADITNMVGWLEMDKAGSTGRLHTDLSTEVAGYRPRSQRRQPHCQPEDGLPSRSQRLLCGRCQGQLGNSRYNRRGTKRVQGGPTEYTHELRGFAGG